jgi:hypothetical protein
MFIIIVSIEQGFNRKILWLAFVMMAKNHWLSLLFPEIPIIQ